MSKLTQVEKTVVEDGTAVKGDAGAVLIVQGVVMDDDARQGRRCGKLGNCLLPLRLKIVPRRLASFQLGRQTRRRSRNWKKKGLN